MIRAQQIRQNAAPEPKGLHEAVSKQFGCYVKLRNKKAEDYKSEVRPLWNGTIYTYDLIRDSYPRQIYVFRMPKTDGAEKWLYCDAVSFDGPLEAVKAALRQIWTSELPFSTHERSTIQKAR